MITYYLLVPIFYFFANLPTGVLYKFSNFIAFVLRSIVGYRKEVVLTNLRNSFPEKPEEEIQTIAKESYQHLADRVVENIRCLAITKGEVTKRLMVKNPEMLDDAFNRGESVVLMVGHIGSWELGGYRLSTGFKFKTFGIVSPVSNPYFNDLIQRTRGKMGMHLVPMNKSKEFFAKPLTEPTLGVFISDQSPSNLERAYWTRFLNQDTAFFTGGARYAKQHNCTVIYPKIVQVKQGYYTGEFLTIAKAGELPSENEIVEKFVRMLEVHIQEHPADWLWSHKRWKHKRNTV